MIFFIFEKKKTKKNSQSHKSSALMTVNIEGFSTKSLFSGCFMIPNKNDE